MSLSDCSKCWDTPCRCGYEYLSWSEKAIDDFIDTLERVKQFKSENKYVKMTPEMDRIYLEFIENWKKPS